MGNQQISNLEVLVTGLKFVIVNIPIFYAAFNARSHFKIVNRPKNAPKEFSRLVDEDEKRPTEKVDKAGIDKEATVCANEFVDILRNLKHISLDKFYKNMHPYAI